MEIFTTNPATNQTTYNPNHPRYFIFILDEIISLLDTFFQPYTTPNQTDDELKQISNIIMENVNILKNNNQSHYLEILPNDIINPSTGEVYATIH